MKFYTHYSTHKDNIFLRYIDDNGKRQSTLLPYKPKYYLDNPNETESKYRTIFDKATKEYECSSIKDFYRKIKEYKDVEEFEIYGSSNPALQFVVEQFPDNLLDIFEKDSIRRLNIDIETENEVSVGFPDIVDPKEEINVITVYDTVYKKYVVFYINEVDWNDAVFLGMDIKPVRCNDEKDLLNKFVKFWSMDFPDVVSGWNIDNFDIPYIVNRIEKVLGESAMRNLSPLGSISRREGTDEFGRIQYDYSIKGVEIVDTFKLYLKIELEKRESYSLEFISMFELNVGKLRHPSGIPGHLLYQDQDMDKISTDGDWSGWENHKEMIDQYKAGKGGPALKAKIQKEFYKAFVLYNIIDVKRCYEVEEKKNLFAILYFLAYYSYSNIGESMSSMRFWANLIFAYCYNDLGLVHQMHKKREMKLKSYQGAYVREPLRGLYKGPGSVVTYDIASMYPSLIRVLNISPEKICNKSYTMGVENMLAGKFPKIDERHAVGANGASFDKESQGVLPKKVEELFNKRKAEKRAAKEVFKKIEAVNKEIASREK